MQFREKLSLLRTQMNLSQENLANRLNVSTQSVTKWENGQSFPDIQNLIQLSDSSKYSKQDLRLFLLRAKNSTYISSDNLTLSSRPNSKDFRYCENDFMYIDSYIGNEKFIGEEAVWLKDNPIYGMNYYGHILSGNFDIAFLKEALACATLKFPFRGPEFYQQGDYTYNCKVQGDIALFYGEESIYCNQKKVYFCLFHGGIIL